MDNQIELRTLEIKDLGAIKEIINEVWDFASLIQSDKVLDATLALYFNSVIMNATFAEVALFAGELVGVIFGSIEGAKPKFLHMLENPSAITMTLMQASDDERRGICEYFGKQSAVYDELLELQNETYDGCLDFIILSERVQGKGVGKALWNSLTTYFKEHDVSKLYVFTDTDCNYGFYDHLGFTRRAEKEVVYNFDDFEYTPVNFLYDYRIDDED